MVVTDRWSLSNKTPGPDLYMPAISTTEIEGTVPFQNNNAAATDPFNTAKYKRITLFYKATENGAGASSTWTWQSSADNGTTWHNVTTIDGTTISAVAVSTTIAGEAYSIKVVAPLMRISFAQAGTGAINNFTWNIFRVEVLP